MCRCTPEIKTMYCMRGDCKPPRIQEKEELTPDKRPIMYVFLNKSLNMSVGKAAAQAVHAANRAMIEAHDSSKRFWKNAVHQTVIILEARDSEHIRNIQDYLKERKFKTFLVIDEGVNEIDPHVPTALATTILDKDDESVKAALSTFNLYRDIVKLTLEINRD